MCVHLCQCTCEIVNVCTLYSSMCMCATTYTMSLCVRVCVRVSLYLSERVCMCVCLYYSLVHPPSSQVPYLTTTYTLVMTVCSLSWRAANSSTCYQRFKVRLSSRSPTVAPVMILRRTVCPGGRVLMRESTRSTLSAVLISSIMATSNCSRT